MEFEKEFLFEGPWDKFLVYESKKFPKCLDVISAMMKRVALWDKFPALDVIFRDDEYYLYCQGNHRALAHYFMNAPMRCKLINEDDCMFFRPEEYFPIGNGKVRNIDFEIKDDVWRMEDSLSYFSREDVFKFCLENDLNPKSFLSQ